MEGEQQMLFGVSLTVRKPGAKSKRAPPTMLHFGGESFKLSKEAVEIVEGIIRRRRKARERNLIIAEAVRRLKAWRAIYGEHIWFTGVELSSAELSLEERGLIVQQRTPIVAALMKAADRQVCEKCKQAA